jgi:hypothetical protein
VLCAVALLLAFRIPASLQSRHRSAAAGGAPPPAAGGGGAAPQQAVADR